MTVNISNLSIQSSLVSVLQGEQSTLTQLTTQLSTQQKYQDLTDYDASDARDLINLQSTATQKQAYINVINGVSTNLSIYNTTLTDLESLATQAQQIAANNPNYSTDTASNVSSLANNYLKSATVDLNQQVNGRYIYSGSRFNTAPVQDLTQLPSGTLSTTINTDGSTVPTYDTASTLNLSTTSTDITVNGSVNTTSGVAQTASVTVNGTTYTYNVLTTDTPATIAAGLQSELAAGGVGATVSGDTISITDGSTINSATTATTDTSAYAADSALVDTNYQVNYGITSNDPSIQQLVAGLRYLQAAGSATDSATYQSDMQNANTLLTTALQSLQSLNTGVANNISLMTNEKNTQTTAISDLTNQVSNIQSVDITQVSAEITAMETILQASYAVTGDIEKMSIVSYLPT